jgi:phosphoglycerate dehydrogenase-like enzyme
MKKITIIGNFPFDEQQNLRLKFLGDIKTIGTPQSAEEWTNVSRESDVIISDGSGLLENLNNLQDVFVTYPYVELGNFDSKKLAENNVYVANARGGNRSAIVELVIFQILSIFRKFPSMINVVRDIPLEFNDSLASKKVLIVGKGNIGQKIGQILTSFDMDVDYFCRGDNLIEKGSKADLIVNALSSTSTSKNLLNEEFFMSLKKGSYFVSFVRHYTFDIDGVIKSLDNNILKSAAIDCDPEQMGNTTNPFYQKILNHDKILATPHIAFTAKEAITNSREIVVKNVEAFCNGEPINILSKQ